MNDQNVIITSVAQVKRHVEEEHGNDKIKASVIRSVMSKDMGMRYRKITRINWTHNSMGNLILR